MQVRVDLLQAQARQNRAALAARDESQKSLERAKDAAEAEVGARQLFARTVSRRLFNTVY